MSAMAVDVMTALSRVAYDNPVGCLEYLVGLDRADLEQAAYGLAVMGNAFLNSLAETTGVEVELVRDSWLARLTDVANAHSP